MRAAVIPPAIAPRIGALLRMLGSDVDNEALGAARALRRTLGGAGLDLHALADAVEHPGRATVCEAPAKPQRNRKARTGDVVLDYAQRRVVVEALRRGLAGGRMTPWERTFAGSIVEQLQGQRWRLTERQAETLARLLAKVGEDAAWV